MIYIIYFIITIGILVFIHEFGHFIAAKICKMRTDVFAIGFGKRLFGWNKINGFTTGDLPKDFDKKGHTDYRFALLPLGGYVKISGMIDESFDTEFADKEPQPYEFRAKPTYQKLFVITAGVLMNLFLTVAIFWGINFFHGKQVILTTTIGKVAQGSLASKAGFKSNDKILKINGQKVESWNQIMNSLLINNLGRNVTVTVLRDKKIDSFTIPRQEIDKAAQNPLFIMYGHTQPIITDVLSNSPAHDAGMKRGDILLRLNNIPLNNSEQTVKVITSNKDKAMPLVILRGKDTVKTAVTPGIEGKIGVAIADVYTGKFNYQKFGFFASFEHSFIDIGRYTALTFIMFKDVIVGKVQFGQVFGGPIKIAKFAVQSAHNGIISFLFFLAMLSLSLAIINILPFPVLDGGHFVIISIEGIIRKELPIKFKIAIQNAGFVILLLLMAFIIYSDIISL